MTSRACEPESENCRHSLYQGRVVELRIIAFKNKSSLLAEVSQTGVQPM